MIEGKIYLEKLIRKQWNGRMKIVTGIRRCGKSTLLFDLFTDYLRTQGVLDNQIIAVALDDDQNADLRNPDHLSSPSKPPIFLF